MIRTLRSHDSALVKVFAISVDSCGVLVLLLLCLDLGWEFGLEERH
jgi:hypothetical protein